MLVDDMKFIIQFYPKVFILEKHYQSEYTEDVLFDFISNGYLLGLFEINHNS